jgi:nicotinamidase-related amidase
MPFEKEALIIVDMQNDFIHDEGLVRKIGVPTSSLVLRFINSVTNLFTQDLVLSEPLPIEILPKYVAVIANRST